MTRARTLLLASAIVFARVPAQAQQPVRVGIVGLDSSHAVRFTELLNDSARKDHVPGAIVVAAYKGGSTIEESVTRIDRFTAEVTDKHKVRLVSSIPELCAQVDAVLLLSVDGRQHLEQVRPVLAARKPVYIDKPLAGSLKDAREIVRLARASSIPLFSASSQRYSDHVDKLKKDAAIGKVEGAITFGPSPLVDYMPDLFWYGIHSVEMLYELMGSGCERVSRSHTEGADSIVGVWKDGRIGEIRGLRSSPRTYGAVVFGAKKIVSSELPTASGGESNYLRLVQEIVRFFQTGKSPVPPEQSLEVLAFMEAAERSKVQKGAVVALEKIQ